MITDEKAFFHYAIKCYDNPTCSGLNEFQKDLKKFSYLQRLFKDYHEDGNINIRLVLNYIIILYNIFGLSTTDMLLYKIDPKYNYILKAFLEFLNFIERDKINADSDKKIKENLNQL